MTEKLFWDQLGVIYKIRPQSVGRGLSSADIFQTRGEGFFRCGRPHFLAKKPSKFLKFMVRPHGQRGRRIEPVRTRGREVNFSRFCAEVLYGWPLILTKKF